MSTDMTLFSQGGGLPAHLQNLEMDDMTRSLAGGGGGLRISIKGGVWRLMNGGNEVSKNEERSMNVVIVKAAPKVSRTFYMGTYQEGQVTPPTCWSSDGEVPDAEVKDKQSPKCQTCPQNVAGSGQGDSRACRYSQRIAVVLEGDLDGGVYGLTLPAQSIFGKPDAQGKMPLQAYAKQLASHRLPVSVVVTEMRFDTSSATPKLTFRAVRPLSVGEIESCRRQGDTVDAENAVKFTVFQQDGGKDSAPATPAGQVFSQGGADAVAAAQANAAVADAKAPKTRAKAKTADAAVEEPVVREPAKAPQATPTAGNVSQILDAWGDDD